MKQFKQLDCVFVLICDGVFKYVNNFIDMFL